MSWWTIFLAFNTLKLKNFQFFVFNIFECGFVSKTKSFFYLYFLDLRKGSEELVLGKFGLSDSH